MTVREKITAAAEAYGISPALALAVAQTESAFNPAAVSPKGAKGVFQLMPRTAAAYGVTDPFDPDQNIDGGVHMLADLTRQYHGDTAAILAAYNWGSGNLASGRQMPTETVNYIARITSLLGLQDTGTVGTVEEPLTGGLADVSSGDLPAWAVQVAVGLGAVSLAWLFARALRR